MATERRSGADRRSPITVMVVDSEPLTRAALAQALESGRLDVVAQAHNGDDAIKLALEQYPDVILTAISLS
jgi:two-component system nitrate/nitrite response regulator NarL